MLPMPRPDLILGIESSCDDTAAAVVSTEREILSSVVADQNALHQAFGGVVPEIAARAHADIAECSVFGLPDERFVEVPAAVILTKEGRETVTPAALREFLLTNTAPFKVPLEEHIFVVHDTLPRLGTQKVDKKTLREHYTKQLAAA